MKRREKKVNTRPLKFSSWDGAFRYAKEDFNGLVVVEIVAPAPRPGIYQIYPDGGAIRQLESEPTIPVGFRPLMAGEDLDEFDMVYDLLLDRWIEIDEGDVADFKAKRFRDVFWNNPMPFVRRIGEGEVADGDREK